MSFPHLGCPVLSHLCSYCVYSLYNGLTTALNPLTPFVFSLCAASNSPLGFHSWLFHHIWYCLSHCFVHMVYTSFSPTVWSGKLGMILTQLCLCFVIYPQKIKPFFQVFIKIVQPIWTLKVLLVALMFPSVHTGSSGSPVFSGRDGTKSVVVFFFLSLLKPHIMFGWTVNFCTEIGHLVHIGITLDNHSDH